MQRITRFVFVLVAALVAVVLVAPAALAVAGGISVSHINGDPVKGTIEKMDGDRLHLKDLENPESPAELDLGDVEDIEYINQRDLENAPVAKWPFRIHLTSGDVFIGQVIKNLGEDGFVFESMAFGRILIGLDWIERIDVRASQQERPFEADPDALDGEKDALYFPPAEGADRGDITFGSPPNGLVAVYPDEVEFYDDAEVFRNPLPWDMVHAVTRYVRAPLDQPDEFQAIVACRNGERFTGKVLMMKDRTWTIRSWVLKPGEFLEDEDGPEGETERHKDGLTVSVREERLLKLTLRHGKFAYLSDMKTSAETEYPWFGGPGAAPRNPEDYWWHYRRDRSVTGEAIKLQGADMREVIYTKGIGVHSYCKLSFPINGKYVKFLADIGIDTSSGRQGSVVFEVWADDENTPRYRSPSVVRRSAALQSIEVDVRGVRVLHLVVDFGDNGDIQDRANWAKARVIKGE